MNKLTLIKPLSGKEHTHKFLLLCAFRGIIEFKGEEYLPVVMIEASNRIYYRISIEEGYTVESYRQDNETRVFFNSLSWEQAYDEMNHKLENKLTVFCINFEQFKSAVKQIFPDYAEKFNKFNISNIIRSNEIDFILNKQISTGV